LCIKALNENREDIHKNLYDFAVIEIIEEGVMLGARELIWFKWDDKKQVFFEIEMPEHI
jgi:hypothetical protein